jgi:hypothetical protein
MLTGVSIINQIFTLNQNNMEKAFDEPILQFIINYLWGQMSQPASEFFLPKLLASQQSSYDPYEVGHWDLGTLPEKVDAACNSQTQLGKCSDYPTLVLDNVLIKGLYNLQPSGAAPKVNGTNVQVMMNFNKLPPGQYVTSQFVTITGNYTYTQGCTPTMPPGPNNYTVVGTGTFTAQIFEAQGYANIDIIPDPNDGSKLLVRVNAMSLIAPPTTTVAKCTAQGAKSNTNICISIQMSSGNQFNFLANQAANYAQVTKMMVDRINNQLANPGALQDLGNMLTRQVNNIFNDGTFMEAQP